MAENRNPKKKSDSVPRYNTEKVGVDVYDQMKSLHSFKAESRRWPMHVFYIVVDLALIHSWVPYKHVCQSNISVESTYKNKAKELIGNMSSGPSRKHPAEALDSKLPNIKNAAKKRLTCSIPKCRNSTTYRTVAFDRTVANQFVINV